MPEGSEYAVKQLRFAGGMAALGLTWKRPDHSDYEHLRGNAVRQAAI